MRLYYKDITGLIKETYLSSGRDYFNKGKVNCTANGVIPVLDTGIQEFCL